jgi:hypothetical protein
MQQGVIKVYRKAAEPFALQRRLILKQLVENGLPKLVVDSGKINAKLTFTTHQIADSDQDSQSGSGGADAGGEPGDHAGADAAGHSPRANASSSTPEAERIRRNLVSNNTRFISEGLTVNTSSLGSRLAVPILPINRFVGLIKPNLNEQIRLTVKPASNQTPQDAQTTTNIYSEVEIHFKTIV